MTLVGPTVTRSVQDPLAVLLLDNQLYIPDVTSQYLLTNAIRSKFYLSFWMVQQNNYFF